MSDREHAVDEAHRQRGRTRDRIGSLDLDETVERGFPIERREQFAAVQLQGQQQTDYKKFVTPPQVTSGEVVIDF